MTSTDNTSKRIKEILYEFINQFKDDGYLAQGNTDEAKSLIMELVNEARIEEINLFREAMINHSTPMIYAPKRIEQLKSGEL